jgi:hypothetical protein
MKTLKIVTHWTVAEADCIHQLLEEFRAALWESYGEEILAMHKEIWLEQQQKVQNNEFDDELPF